MHKKLHIFSFFSGSGFLDLGFEMSGFTIDQVNEYSESFQKAYRYSREKLGINPPRFGYTQDINFFQTPEGAKELLNNMKIVREEGNLVGFIGGPPCPDFSIAGKQRGKDGDNGKLSQSYINVIIEQKPDFFLFENVKGLWKTAKHRAYYDDLKKQLKNFYLLTDRLCNALEFGVPQDRDRILLFGIKKNIAKELALQIEDFNWDRHIQYDLNKIKLLDWPKATPFKEEVQTECPSNIPIELTAQYWFKKNDVENHPNSQDFFKPRAGLTRMQTVLEGDDCKKSYKRIHRWRYSPTVCYGNNEVHLHPYKARRLSASEALSLQSLPKEYVLPEKMSLSDKFKTIGNGVPFKLAEGIAKTIQEFIDKE